MKTFELTVTGLVQGVGYRPFTAGLLKNLNLCGTVRNTGGIVKICVTAADKAVDELLHRLYEYYPEGARIDKILVKEIDLTEFTDVTIIESDEEESVPVLPADIGICQKCTSELKDKKNRRYNYPFISCAICGPRYSIMHRIPYDRDNTTMGPFGMCDKCREEYNDPHDRRYYAQTISCPDCGPRLFLESEAGLYYEYAYSEAVNLLRNEQVIAVKNTGGYHLVCDAFSEKAVNKLREIKKRDKKPFAVMVSDAEKAEKYGEINKTERDLLTSPARPVVLLKRKLVETKAEEGKPAEREPVYGVSMESPYVGILLPADGLQVMLAEEFPLLVMTSANISGEPMIISDEEIKALGVAVLGNNREILSPVDDSVVRVVAGRVQVLRRGRGYVPQPLEIKNQTEKEQLWSEQVFATGADMKSSFAYAAGNRIYLSQYLGDLSHKRVQTEYKLIRKRFKQCFNLKEKVLVSDRHPGYFSTKMGENEEGLPVYSVIHHFAHMASVMAEYGLREKTIGFSFDGTGYGEDGGVWGGEVCLYNDGAFERVGHLKQIVMTGGDEGARNGMLSLAGYYYDLLLKYGKEELINSLGKTFVDEKLLTPENNLIFKALEKNINTVVQTSAGRLFDAVATLLGVCNYNGYEGQCPCELEYAAFKAEDTYPLRLESVKNNPYVADTTELIYDMLKAVNSGVSPCSLAAGFHNALAEWILSCAVNLGDIPVVLAGGTFANRMLTELCISKLEAAGLKVYTNSLIPPGDDGIAVGQLTSLVL
ncbi:MAG: carbamoyltransferase HypF [Lachnospiraceae bacterium]